MTAFQVCGFALLGVTVVLILRNFRPEYATVAGIAVGMLLLIGTWKKVENMKFVQIFSQMHWSAALLLIIGMIFMVVEM